MNSIITSIKHIHAPTYYKIIDNPGIVAISAYALGFGLASCVLPMLATAAVIIRVALPLIICLGLPLFSFFAASWCRDYEIEQVALRLITPAMDGFEKILIMAGLGETPSRELADIVTQSLRIITPEGNGQQIFSVLLSLLRIPANERENVVSQVLQLMEHEPLLGDRVRILNCVSLSLANERLPRLNRAMVQLQEDFQQFPNLTVYDRVRALLETPLNENFPPVNAVIVAAAAPVVPVAAAVAEVAAVAAVVEIVAAEDAALVLAPGGPAGIGA